MNLEYVSGAGPSFKGRVRTRDMHTLHHMRQAKTHDAKGNALGTVWDRPYRTADGRTVDSSGSFFVGELERLDLKLHEPLVSVSFGRDIDLREDVTIADEVSSFTVSTFVSGTGLGTGAGIGNSKHWIGKTTTQIPSGAVDIAKIAYPLHLWGYELKYTIPELESAARLGRPIDQQLYAAMQLAHQMEIDESVYIGDTSMNYTGLVNHVLMTNFANAANGAAGSPLWTQKTPDEILGDINNILTSVWAASAWAVVPNRILIPPAQFGYISTQKVSQAGNVSILKYVLENNLLTTSGRGKLEILPLKWLIGAGVGGTLGTVNGHDRLLCYTKDKERIRYPMTMLQRTPIQYDGIYHKSTYFCRFGQMELVYPETIGALDGI